VLEVKMSRRHWTSPKNLFYLFVMSGFTAFMTWSLIAYVWIEHGLIHVETNSVSISV